MVSHILFCDKSVPVTIAHPQVAYRGTASDMEGSCEYIEYAVADSRRGVVTRTILGEEYKSFSSSLCNLLHSPVTSSLLGPNIFRIIVKK